MVMYAANVYLWKRYRVNYAFIFGFKQGTELGYREVLFISFGLAASAIASVLSNLDMEMDPKTMDYKPFTEIIPLILVVVRLFNLFIMRHFFCHHLSTNIYHLTTDFLVYSFLCSLCLLYCSCHSTSCIDQVVSSSSHVCFTVSVPLFTR